MLRLTKNAQAVLKKELSDYESFLLNRAMLYANQEDSIEIKDKHISKAKKDFRNSFYYESRVMAINKERRKYYYATFLFATICLVMYILLVLLLFRGETATNSVELVSVVGGITALVLVLTLFFSRLKARRVRKEKDSHGKVVQFLNSWNEFEALLRNLYRKKNSKDPKSFRDLLNFYQEQENVDAADRETLHRLLNSRNNIIHRNLSDVNGETIDGLIKDMDGIIENLKSIE